MEATDGWAEKIKLTVEEQEVLEHLELLEVLEILEDEEYMGERSQEADETYER